MKRDIYRTLRITHGNFGYDENNTYEEICACIRARIEDLKTKGYGGIVTNVRYENYMKDPDEWPLMQEKVKVAQRSISGWVTSTSRAPDKCLRSSIQNMGGSGGFSGFASVK